MKHIKPTIGMSLKMNDAMNEEIIVAKEVHMDITSMGIIIMAGTIALTTDLGIIIAGVIFIILGLFHLLVLELITGFLDSN